MVFSVGLLALCILSRWGISLSSAPERWRDLPDIYSVRVLEEFPHYHMLEGSEKAPRDDFSYMYNRHPFTQGLTFLNSTTLVESAGLFQGGFIKLIEFPSMRSLRHKTLERGRWGEGAAVLGDHIYQLTWTNGVMFGYSLDLSARKLYSIPIIGWGLTSDNKSRMWATSGTDELYELDIPDFDSSESRVTIKKVTKLTCLGRPMFQVNEMEYIAETNTIWGNIFQLQIIVEFSPETGRCISIASLKSIYDPSKSTMLKHTDLLNDVLNGIAYHPSHQENKVSSSDGLNLFVTGKRWPRLYKIQLNKAPIKTQGDPRADQFGSYEEFLEFFSPHAEPPSPGSENKLNM
ncbi:glutamine cyclotransferase [Cryptosporidium canis]|uniref:Glutamine cyclotransferase n=1 Tax=Cryptosporidium canis TaxID=195482 RepID=A0ABQ8P304_9CRYT|nr:glutamine cyclotransferase [Cryptosporidium canis]KAJ1606279.1 glutamine cyclotransferase [Cryptosporidium canis]